MAKHQAVGKITMEVLDNHVEDIMVGAIEGGINYWACLDNTGENWDNRPKGTPASIWTSELLLQGKEVVFTDDFDNDKRLVLTLDKLIQGIQKNFVERPHDNSLADADSVTYDCIIQYALLGDVVYG